MVADETCGRNYVGTSSYWAGRSRWRTQLLVRAFLEYFADEAPRFVLGLNLGGKNPDRAPPGENTRYVVLPASHVGDVHRTGQHRSCPACALDPTAGGTFRHRRQCRRHRRRERE